MTNEQHVSNIQALGYSTREARFLAAVALYSGYFVRRQFDAVIGANRGRRSQEFTNKLIGRGHARRYVFEHDRQVFHLQYKPFYEALGDPDSPNRKERQSQTIKGRLMMLDFIQASPSTDFLVTGQRKVALFEGRGIPTNVLPTKVYPGANGTRRARQFADRLPIFTSASDSGSLDRICFTYIDSAFETGSAFVTHLRRYKRLFHAIAEFDLIYVGTNQSRFGEAENIFAKVLSADRRQSMAPNDLTRMLEYFRDWDLVERGLSQSFSREKLVGLQDARHEFSSPFRDLFELWKHGGDAAVRTELEVKQVSQGHFVRYVLPFDYEFFGHEEAFS